MREQGRLVGVLVLLSCDGWGVNEENVSWVCWVCVDAHGAGLEAKCVTWLHFDFEVTVDGSAPGLIQRMKIYQLSTQRTTGRCCNFLITTTRTSTYGSMYISRSVSYSTLVANSAPGKEHRASEMVLTRLGYMSTSNEGWRTQD